MSGALADRAISELVAHLAQSPAEAQAAPRVLSPDEDLPGDLVRQHRLGSLAYKAGYADYHQDYVKNALLAELRERVLAEMVEALRQQEIRVLLLKGISYVGVIYDDPAERPMGDIDVMVPQGQHAAAVAVLARLGYVPRAKKVEQSSTHHAKTLSRPDGARIDLHRSMIQPLRSRIDLRAVWERALPAIEREDGAERLDPVDEACFHLVHMARHELMVPAICYIEARRLLARRGVDWRRVRERSRDFRLTRAVTAARAMSEALARPGPSVQWSDTRSRILPEPIEVLRGAPVPRGRQIARKAALVEGPKELVGLLAVATYERMGRSR